MIVAERIKQLRQEKGWSQHELAMRMGYADRSAITYIEKGKRDLSQSKIAQFADVLGVSPSHLMGLDIAPESAGATAAMVLKNPGAYKLVTDYFSLSAPDRFLVEQLAASLAAKQKKD